MVRLDKIYTRKGDHGKTRLANGKTISKCDARIQANGDLDEINASLGLVQTIMDDQKLKTDLEHIQNDLFDAGADLSMPYKNSQHEIHTDIHLRLLKTQTQWLEQKIDHFNQNLEPLDSFILPGGTETAARLHYARTVCRRAERNLVNLIDKGEYINPYLLSYINRLSDFLFVAARWCNHQGKADLKWKAGAFR